MAFLDLEQKRNLSLSCSVAFFLKKNTYLFFFLILFLKIHPKMDPPRLPDPPSRWQKGTTYVTFTNHCKLRNIIQVKSGLSKDLCDIVAKYDMWQTRW